MHSHLWWLRGEGEKGRFTYLVGAKADLAALTFHKLNNFKNRKMGNLLYIIAVILLILWAIGYVGFQAGGIIHILIVIAIIAVLFRVIRGR